MQKRRKPINNIWFYFSCFLLMMSIAYPIVGFNLIKNKNVENWDQSWFWVVFAIIVSLFIFNLVMFIINLIKYKKQDQQKLKQNKIFESINFYKNIKQKQKTFQ